MGEVNTLPEGVIVTPLNIIERKPGNIMHAMKEGDHGYSGFGEAYFTFVNNGAIKGWKKHSVMTLNLVVPVGEVKFVLFDDRKNSATKSSFFEIILSRSNYHRLTVPPNMWIAFQGTGEEENMILNLASIRHDPNEAADLPIENSLFQYHHW